MAESRGGNSTIEFSCPRAARYPPTAQNRLPTILGQILGGAIGLPSAHRGKPHRAQPGSGCAGGDHCLAAGRAAWRGRSGACALHHHKRLNPRSASLVDAAAEATVRRHGEDEVLYVLGRILPVGVG